MKRAQWIWCFVAFKLYIWLPSAMTHKSRYGRFTLWLLGYGGAYAHSADFAFFRDHVNFLGGYRV